MLRRFITNSLMLVLLVIGAGFHAAAQERAPGSKIVHPNPHRAVLHSEIVIDAPVNKVWAVATDFGKMAEWSPIFRNLEGDLKPGADVVGIYEANGQIIRSPAKLTWVEGQRFGWRGATVYGTELHDNHMFLFVPTADGKTLFLQTDDLTNVGRDADMTELANLILQSFEVYNTALKARVESMQ